MKKIIVLLYVLIFSAPYIQASVCENKGEERQNCLCFNYQSDFTIAQCNYNAIKKVEKEIKNCYKGKL